jgi:L-malate glycosyltransferase
MRVIAVHLLNDYSGSPKVLMQLLKGWIKNDLETHLYTSGKREGFLSDIAGIHEHFYWYQFAKNPFIRLFFLTFSQIALGVKLLFFLKNTDVLYVNTVLPFGAGIVGKIRGCKVIYHIHETSMKPLLLKKFLFGIVRWSASEVVYVSNFLAQQEPMKNKKNVLYNVLENSFVKEATQNRNANKTKKIVLMICSLKAYKGVHEFLALAQMSPQLTFKLIVNANQAEIDAYFSNETIPTNLFLYPVQKNTHPFYKEASVLLNLSDVNLWVETFGLTILEGMAYGLPAIVPPVGGVVELVTESVNGYLINSKNTNAISEKLNLLCNDEDLYQTMRIEAIEKSNQFSEAYFENESFRILSI